MPRLSSLPRWLATLAVTVLPLLSATVPLCPVLADVAPRPFRPQPRPVITWQEVRPIEPVLQLARSTGSPMSLTSSDGAGLELVALEAKAVVEDPLTFTELHLTFRNPESRVREGQFEIMLPPGAAISNQMVSSTGRCNCSGCAPYHLSSDSRTLLKVRPIIPLAARGARLRPSGIGLSA